MYFTYESLSSGWLMVVPLSWPPPKPQRSLLFRQCRLALLVPKAHNRLHNHPTSTTVDLQKKIKPVYIFQTNLVLQQINLKDFFAGKTVQWSMFGGSEVTRAPLQRRIQDFPRGRGTPTPQGMGANIRFCQIFPKTAWNQKNLGVQRGCTPLAPPKSATALIARVRAANEMSFTFHSQYLVNLSCTKKGLTLVI